MAETAPALHLWHGPYTRSFTARLMLEELAVPYTVDLVNIFDGSHRPEGLLAINPLGKVPALVVTEPGAAPRAMTEVAAILLYLADRFPQAALSVAVDHPDRPVFLRGLVLAVSAVEQAALDLQSPTIVQEAARGYGSVPKLLTTLERMLDSGPFLLGDRLTAADLLLGTTLDWSMAYFSLPRRPRLEDYAAAIRARPSWARVEALDAASGVVPVMPG